MFRIANMELIYLYLLIPVLVVVAIYMSFRVKKLVAKFADQSTFNRLTENTSVNKRRWKFGLMLFALTCMITAVLRPQLGSGLEEIKRKGVDVIVALDVSNSMNAKDISPTRLERSTQAIYRLIDKLQGDRIGIIVFAGQAFIQLPITTDYSVAKMFLQSMNTEMVSSVGTSLDEAIRLSATYFDDKKTSKLLILVSDGEDHSEGAEAAAEEANKLGIKIITIGVGTPNGGTIPLRRNGVMEGLKRDSNNEVVITKLNSESLTAIAKATKGGYANGANTKEVIDYVKNALNNIEKTEFEATQMADFQSQFQWFLGFAFVLLFADVFLLERKTKWVNKLNLFNEKE